MTSGSTTSWWLRAARRIRVLSSAHPGLTVVLTLHAVVFASVVGRGSPWATVSLDCITGTVPEIALSEPAWSMWDMSDGLVGGLVLAGSLGLPLFALLGVGSGLGKVLAWAVSVLVLLLVYRVLLRAAPPAWAALGAAGVAFSPPVVFHTSMIYGNWHWTQLLFDYGAAAIALHLAWPRPGAEPPSTARWVPILGLVCGLGLFNSPQSLPFVVLACGAAALGLGLRRTLRSLPLLCLGGLLGLAPLLWRLRLQMSTAASEGGGGDPVWARIFRFRLEWDKLGDLFGSKLPGTLHVGDALPSLSEQLGSRLEATWVALSWVGCILALVALLASVLRSRRSGGDRGALAAAALPLSFCGAFVLAYVAIDTRIEVLPPDFSNIREHSHRMLPPLLVAMVASAPLGWLALWSLLERRLERPASRRVRGLLLLCSAVPAAIGLLAQVSMAWEAPGWAAGGPAAYRSTCFDVPGFFRAGKVGGRQEAERRCSELSSPEREADCLAGVAWGVGFYAGRLEGRERGLRDPCSRIPPDLRARCTPWGGDEVPSLLGGVEEACAELGPERRELCLLGAGWFTSQVAWGSTSWPLQACESLGSELDREGCWRGPGFHAADHLHPTPQRLRRQIERAPVERRAAVARGAGYLLGRTYSSRDLALALCAELGTSLLDSCSEGVDDARRHSAGR